MVGTFPFSKMMVVARLFLVFLALPRAAQGQPRTIIRSEREEVLIGPQGELVEIQQHSNEGAADFSESEANELDFCNEDFVQGVVDSSNCSSAADEAVPENALGMPKKGYARDPSKHHQIYRESLCETAAKAHGMAVGRPEAGAPFVVDAANYDRYPRGCFKETGKDAYFFNPIGDWPLRPVGTPICHRPNYTLSPTPDSNTGCPDGYENVLIEDDCRSYSDCTSHCEIEEFRVGIDLPNTVANPSKDERPPDASEKESYNNHPKGCFVSHSDNCTYFNVPRAEDPTSPKGISVCAAKALSGGAAAAAAATSDTKAAVKVDKKDKEPEKKGKGAGKGKL